MSIGAYATQFADRANSLFQQAKSYVAAETPNSTPAFPYKWNIPGQGQIVLQGRARALAIQHTALKNREVQVQHINNVASGILGCAVYHYGWWEHNPLLSLFVVPVAFAHKKISQLITAHFKVQSEGLKRQIASAITVPVQVPVQLVK